MKKILYSLILLSASAALFAQPRPDERPPKPEDRPDRPRAERPHKDRFEAARERWEAMEEISVAGKINYLFEKRDGERPEIQRATIEKERRNSVQNPFSGSSFGGRRHRTGKRSDSQRKIRRLRMDERRLGFGLRKGDSKRRQNRQSARTAAPPRSEKGARSRTPSETPETSSRKVNRSGRKAAFLLPDCRSTVLDGNRFPLYDEL